jgi:hypothetical protein
MRAYAPTPAFAPMQAFALMQAFGRTLVSRATRVLRVMLVPATPVRVTLARRVMRDAAACSAAAPRLAVTQAPASALCSTAPSLPTPSRS